MEIWMDLDGFGLKTWMYKRKDFSEKLNENILVSEILDCTDDFLN